MLQLAMADRRGADDQTAVANGTLQGTEFFGLRQKLCGAHGGNSFAKGLFERSDQAHVQDAEVVHRARRGADVEWITGTDENNPKVPEIGGIAQSAIILR